MASQENGKGELDNIDGHFIALKTLLIYTFKKLVKNDFLFSTSFCCQLIPSDFTLHHHKNVKFYVH